MENISQNISGVVDTVEKTAGEGVKVVVSKTSSVLDFLKNNIFVVGLVLLAVLLVVGYYAGCFDGLVTKESFASYTSLEDIKSSSNPVFVLLKMQGCGWCTKADNKGGSWNELENSANNSQLKVNGKLVDLVKADSGANPGMFNDVSQAIKARGYPTFALCKDGKFTVFKDKRNAESMKNFISKNL